MFEAPGPKCARLDFSGCRVKPRGPKAAGVSHDGPGLHKNSTRRPREGRKERILRQKKSEILGGPAEGGPGEEGGPGCLLGGVSGGSPGDLRGVWFQTGFEPNPLWFQGGVEPNPFWFKGSV